jgi:hypothetical protein
MPSWGVSIRTAEYQREHDLDMRAAALNAQELRLSEREAAIVRREGEVAAREERASALLRLAGAQQEEREALDRKHREEMERLMTDWERVGGGRREEAGEAFGYARPPLCSKNEYFADVNS